MDAVRSLEDAAAQMRRLIPMVDDSPFNAPQANIVRSLFANIEIYGDLRDSKSIREVYTAFADNTEAFGRLFGDVYKDNDHVYESIHDSLEAYLKLAQAVVMLGRAAR
ncbi:MAG: hypothetical protein EOS27_20435 [Mesorhizobium sp.]|nr:MAG: hypothetical protein EOS27_20435 [Mesorhizobium sp.]